MDVGTAGFTEFDNFEELFDLFDEKPELEDMRHGLMHSHNSMNTFFSGTDESTLVDGSNQYDLFLSIITNNKQEIIGRIAFKGEHSFDYTLGGITRTEKTEKVFYAECDIQYPEDLIKVDAIIQDRYESLAKARNTIKPFSNGRSNSQSNHWGHNHYTNYNHGYDDLWGDYEQIFEFSDTVDPTITFNSLSELRINNSYEFAYNLDIDDSSYIHVMNALCTSHTFSNKNQKLTITEGVVMQSFDGLSLSTEYIKDVLSDLLVKTHNTYELKTLSQRFVNTEKEIIEQLDKLKANEQIKDNVSIYFLLLFHEIALFRAETFSYKKERNYSLYIDLDYRYGI